MKFAKTFNVGKYEQVVVIRGQDKDGAPEIRFFFKPDGFGVCNFGIAPNDDGLDTASRLDLAFSEMTGQQAVEIVDGWLHHMQSQAKAAH
jgi:hypothetical protein